LIYSLKNQLNQQILSNDFGLRRDSIRIGSQSDSNNNIDLESQLRNISNDVLLNSQKNFINLAKETFDKVLITSKSDLNKKHDDFISIVDPIKESLIQFNEKINDLEKERISSYSDLRRQISDLMLFQQDIQKGLH
jgi:DNA recombination protein RmuC